MQMKFVAEHHLRTPIELPTTQKLTQQVPKIALPIQGYRTRFVSNFSSKPSSDPDWTEILVNDPN